MIDICRPYAGTYSSAGADAGTDQHGSDDPKEVVTLGTFDRVRVDLGENKTVGGLYIGGLSSADHVFRLYRGDEAGVFDETIIASNVPALTSQNPDGTFQLYYRFDTPVSARYFGARAENVGTFPLNVGIFRALERFTPTYNQEWGAGRFLTDTGSASRLPSGGFGIREGGVASGYEFTLGDLSDAELETLHNMIARVGQTRPIVVVENGSSPTDSGTHYGLFRRLQRYERRSLGVNRWLLRLERWI